MAIAQRTGLKPIEPHTLKDDAGHVLGVVWGTWLRKRVCGSQHMLKHPRHAWAVDAAALRETVRRGATMVEVFDEETGISWTASVGQFSEGFKVNHGWGEQIALPLECWTQRRKSDERDETA